MEARAKIGARHDEIVYEQKRLNAVKAQTKEFVEKTRAICDAQLRALETLPDMTPEEIEQTTSEAKAEHDAAADIAALGAKIVASYEREQAEKTDEDTTTVFPAAKPKAAPAAPKAAEPAAQSAEKEHGAFADMSTRPIKLAELKFGRNYKAGEEDED